jgi:hypothetical protein
MRRWMLSARATWVSKIGTLGRPAKPVTQRPLGVTNAAKGSMRAFGRLRLKSQ